MLYFNSQSQCLILHLLNRKHPRTINTVSRWIRRLLIKYNFEFIHQWSLLSSFYHYLFIYRCYLTDVYPLKYSFFLFYLSSISWLIDQKPLYNLAPDTGVCSTKNRPRSLCLTIQWCHSFVCRHNSVNIACCCLWTIFGYWHSSVITPQTILNSCYF